MAAGCHGAVPSFAGVGEKKTERRPLRRKCHSVLSLVNDYEHKRAALKELKLQDSAGVLIPGRGRELLFFFFFFLKSVLHNEGTLAFMQKSALYVHNTKWAALA